MKITFTDQETKSRRYTACAMGNGDLSFLVDFEGSMKRAPWFEDKKKLKSNIWRAGVRYDTRACDLVGHGAFTQELPGVGEPLSFIQTFEPDSAFFESTVCYAGGIVLVSQIFCHLEHNIIAVRKKISGTEVPYRFLYGIDTHRLTSSTSLCGGGAKAAIAYSVDTEEPISGEILVFADRPCHFSATPNGCVGETLEREVTFYICFGRPAAEFAERQGWSGLFETQKQLWGEYWEESTLDLPEDSRLAKVCRMAEYHLRISSTAWSIPVGLYPSHWCAHYFGFDEFFAFEGLLATGHLSTARKVPEFRHQILPMAKARASRYTDSKGDCAEYPWQADETGWEEVSNPGFWLRHIFHMANIALSSYNYSVVSGDSDFLREKAYPVIRACAEFFRQFYIYRLEDGRCVVGKCTDLERLGPAVENAFMTTCGVIATFKAALDSAEKTGQDAELAAEWGILARDLEGDLPNDGSKYLPYPGCTEASIALLSGIYPYEKVLCPDDGMAIAALDFFLENSEKSGNMYPFGKSVCAWYGSWAAIVLAETGRPEEARRILETLVEDTGCGAETYEIYEVGATPYFTTAEGIFLKAVARVAELGK